MSSIRGRSAFMHSLSRFVATLLCVVIPAIAGDTFKHVEYLYKVEGKDKGKQVDGKLDFDAKAQTILFASKKVQLAVAGPSITSALYERTSRPRYVSGLLLAWPLLLTKGKKHFLTIQYKSEGEGKYAIFHLDKGNYREILAATEATTGRKVERSEER